MHYSTMQCSVVLYNVVLYSTVQCSAVQYSAVQCSGVQHSTVQYSACNAVQYGTVYLNQGSCCCSKVSHVDEMMHARYHRIVLVF